MFLILVLLFIPTFSLNIINNCNILSLSGGGSFGAVEVGILKNISVFNNYDIITGVSVGALNAGLLSYFNHNISLGIDYLVDLYSNLKTEDIYNKYDKKQWSYFSTEPLRKTIKNTLNNLNTSNDYYNGITLIGSTNLNTASLDIFNFNDYLKDDQTNILMASSAIPYIFPPIFINNTYYIDGGAISNQILFGLESNLRCNFYNITYISSHDNINIIDKIDSFFDYNNRIIDVIKSTYDNQLSIINKICSHKNGIIYYYYPDAKYLKNYSILDMNHGIELIDIGLKYNHMKKINYCN